MPITEPSSLRASRTGGGLPPLEPGDHLDQKTFHARYEAMPEDVKAELIGGVVYMTAALRRSHGRFHSLLVHWLGTYEDSTPGVETYDNTTTIKGDDSIWWSRCANREFSGLFIGMECSPRPLLNRMVVTIRRSSPACGLIPTLCCGWMADA